MTETPPVDPAVDEPVDTSVDPAASSSVPVEVALEAAATLEPDAQWHEVVDASAPVGDNRSFLDRALDELQAIAAEIGRLTGSLSLEHQTALDSAVQNVVTAAKAPAAEKPAG